MVERAPFLETIRQALAVPGNQERSAERFPAVFSGPDISGKLAAVSARSAGSRLALCELFRRNAHEIRLQVHEALDYPAAAAVIAAIAAHAVPEFGTDRRIVLHDGPELAQLGLPQLLASDGVTVQTLGPDDPAAREQTIAAYIGVTVADWGIAESATVVQLTEPGRPRSTSLVPSIHIALLPIERLVADLSELHAVMQDQPPASSYVLITGPSKTGDIESHLVYGAHGPRDMHVLIVTGVRDT